MSLLIFLATAFLIIVLLPYFFALLGAVLVFGMKFAETTLGFFLLLVLIKLGLNC